MKQFSDKNIRLAEETALMLGNFDGLHAGHQALLRNLQTVALEKRLKTAVFSFSPHPVSFFSGRPFQTIYSSSEKAFLLAQAGVDYYIEYPFDAALAHMPPEQFVTGILAEQMRCGAVIVGEGYRFGKDRAGDAALLQRLGKELGFAVYIVPLVMKDGVKISASDIRADISALRLHEAAKKLKRPYFVRGVVVKGRQFGRLLGFPTANIKAEAGKLYPPNGVYATTTHLRGQTHPSVTNVGVNPTVTLGEQTVVETYLGGLDADIYGETIQVDFMRFIRGERRFRNAEELKAQIAADAREGLKVHAEKDAGLL